MFGAVSKGFIPDEDNDSMMVTLEAAQGTSYYKMVDYVTQVANIMRQDPNIDSFMSNADTTNTPRFWVQLKPRKMRAQSLVQTIAELRPKVFGFPGIKVSSWSRRPACVSAVIRPSRRTISRCKGRIPISFTRRLRNWNARLRSFLAWWMSRRTYK